MMTKKKLSPGDESTVRQLRDRLLLTLEFMERAEEFPSGPQFRAVVESSAAKGDLRALRLIARDVDAMMIALPAHKREGLEAVLQQRLGIDRQDERMKLQESVMRAVERGRIESEKERRHLEDCAESLESTGENPSQLAAIRALLQKG